MMFSALLLFTLHYEDQTALTSWTGSDISPTWEIGEISHVMRWLCLGHADDVQQLAKGPSVRTVLSAFILNIR